MNKGTALVCAFLSFLSGLGLMWGIAENRAASARLEDRARPRSEERSPLPIHADDPRWGRPDAPVTIIEISDFECPFCKRALPTLEQVKRTYGEDKVRIVWKNNPIGSHRNARPAAEAAATVGGLGGDFWKFHDLVFEGQQRLTLDNLERWAVAAGVDARAFETAMESKRFSAKVDRDIAFANAIGARGTPHFRINGLALNGAYPFAEFEKIIDAQLAEADKLARSGVPAANISQELTKRNYKAPAPQKQAERQAAVEDETVWKVPVLPDDPVRGPADALVTIVEWSDFECPFCARVEQTLDELFEQYPRDIRLVWKDNAMPYHTRAKAAAYLARAAYEQRGDDGFWSAHEALFQNQKSLDRAGLEKIAKGLGLSWAKLMPAIDGGQYAAKIEASMDLASELGARSTPHFFVNGRRLSGAQPYATFKALIDEQLVRAKALESRGVPRSKVYQELMKTAKGAPTPEKKDVPAPTRDLPFKGSQNAKIVIQEFSDFQCPFCSRVQQTLEQVLAKYPKDVKIVWRNMPLSFHEDAALAAEAALEAFEQGGNAAFWQYHDALFENQKALTRADLEKYASELGLDARRFAAALDSRKHKARVERDLEIARGAGFAGTPAFTVNGYFVNGAQPFRDFDKAIQLALAAR